MRDETWSSLVSAGYAAKLFLEWAAPERFVVRGNLAVPAISMTFDDGPHPENTPRILDALDNAGAKATFFVQGAMAVACPDIVRDAVRRGHRVGNHGFLHHSARAVPFSTYLADILKCQSVLQDILGSDVGLDFRPPYGHLTPRTLWAMARNGFRTVFWSIDSRDSFILESGKLVQSIAGTRLRAAEVMLFHDDYAHTAEALPAVLSNLKARGCALSPLQSPQPSAAEGRARSGGIA